MHPIIHPIDMQYIQTVISAYAEAALEQLPALIERAITVIDRGLIEHRGRLLSLAVVLALPRVYFESSFALVPLGILLTGVEAAMKGSLEGHPRHGSLLIALGFCLGTVYDERLGLYLIRCGKVPFNAALSGIYSSNTRLVLGVAIIVFLASAFWEHPAGVMISCEAVAQFMGCLWHYFFTRMMM